MKDNLQKTESLGLDYLMSNKKYYQWLPYWHPTRNWLGLIVVFCTAVLSGCGVNGTYVDYSGSDAVKIRFIADANTSTMGYLDAQHCSGLTTGMLNNLFLKNTSRRADMRVAAPAETSAYLEIKVPPGKEIFLHANSMDTYGTTCGAMRRLVGAAGEEYELLLKQLGRNCGVGLY